MARKILILVLITVLVLSLAGCSKEKVINSEPVAIVNSAVITQAQLDNRVHMVATMDGFDLSDPMLAPFADMFSLQILEGLIDEVLIMQEAQKNNLSVKKEEIDQEIALIKTQFSSETEFKNYFNNYLKVTDQDMRDILEVQLLFHALYEEVTKDINSTEVDLEEYYNNNLEQFFVPEQIQARHILVATEEEALEIIKEIVENNGDMGQLAALKSTDPSAKFNSGDLGYFSRGAMVESFENAAFALEIGEMTLEPVQTVYGYHIIRVEDKQDSRQRTFEEVKDEIEERFIYEAKNQFFHEFMLGLRENAEVENILENKLMSQLEEDNEDKANGEKNN